MSSDELAVGVIGLGFGANHARVLSGLPGVRLAAVCDLDERRLAAVAREGLAGYTDYEAMLRTEKLDAAVVAVPASLHEPVALAVIDAGCAVLVEKPLAPTLREAQRIVEATRAAGVTLMAGHIERFNPAVQELARRVQAGEVGRVLQLTARRMGPIVVRSQDVNVVHDTALHDIDVMRFILGAGVSRVYAEARFDRQLPFEDGILALLRFTDEAGAFGSLDVNWLAPIVIRDLTVRGETGMFMLDFAAQTLVLYSAGPTVERSPSRGWSPSLETLAPAPIPVEPREPLVAELSAFVSALREGSEPPVTAGDALAAVAICDALTESARSGLPVTPNES
jgi:predicted dehydrogenase